MAGDRRRVKGSPTATSLQILEYVGRFGIGVTAKEVVEGLAIPPATCYRLLNSLIEDEYLVRTADLRGFALGNAMSSFVDATTPPLVPRNARAILDDFRRSTRFAVHLFMFRGNGLKIGQADPDHPILPETELRKNLHASAPGKMLLSQVPDWESLLPPGPLARLAAATIRDRSALEDVLTEIRRENLSRDLDELSQGAAGIAVGVPTGDGLLGAALTITGLSERISAMETHIDDLREVALKLAPALF